MAFLLDDILLAPCKFVAAVGRKLCEHAEAELTDESAIRAKLSDLQALLELGRITEPEYLRQEDVLMRRLNQIHRYKEARRAP